LWWLADGRLIYSLLETLRGVKSQVDTNLWEIKVDAASGQPTGKPRRITKEPPQNNLNNFHAFGDCFLGRMV
jgi:hypothetical protein